MLLVTTCEQGLSGEVTAIPLLEASFWSDTTSILYNLSIGTKYRLLEIWIHLSNKSRSAVSSSDVTTAS